MRPYSLTHAGDRHEDPGDHHLGDGLPRSVGRLAQAGPLLVRDRDADFEFSAEQNTRRDVRRRLRAPAGDGPVPPLPSPLSRAALGATWGTDKAVF